MKGWSLRLKKSQNCLAGVAVAVEPSQGKLPLDVKKSNFSLLTTIQSVNKLKMDTHNCKMYRMCFIWLNMEYCVSA